MKIFTNFDTSLRNKIFNDYKQQYGEENTLCFWRSKLYKITKVTLPLFVLTLLTVFWLLFFYRRLDGEYFWYVIAAILIIDLVFFFPVLGKYIDYKMDFIVVIPNSVIMYEQSGIFKRNEVTISAQSIKTISIQKSGLLYSLFDNGDIIILTEGDNEHNGEMVFHRIPRPEKRRNQIVKVIGIDIKANQNPQT